MDTLFVQKSVSFWHFGRLPGPAPSENVHFGPFGHTFASKKCVVLTFSINLAGVLASQTRIISFIYKTEVVLENIFFRISSFIYELRRVLRRRLYATRNFRVWGADGPHGSPESGTAPKPWYSYRISKVSGHPAPPPISFGNLFLLCFVSPCILYLKVWG